jgi:DUF1009 family protein
VKRSFGKIGLIAGAGELPLHIARSLNDSGKNVFIIGLKEAADRTLEDPDLEIVWIDFHRLKELLDTLRDAGVMEVILAGKLEHREIFRSDRFDMRMLTFLEGLADRRGSTILAAFVRLLEEEGYRVPSLLDIVPALVPKSGLVVGPRPGPRQIADLRFGWPLARGIADLDIGQTIIVKGGSVVAVEAMEGTDETIMRASSFAGNGLTVIKRASRDHDFRYDVPTIGQKTVETLAAGGGGLIALEAERSFILHSKDVASLCEERGITLLACGQEGIGEAY